MPYTGSYTDYIANQPRPDAPGNVSWTQTLLIQNYAADLPIAIDKEIKGGLHRVKYRSQLYNSNYDGIFTTRRVKGMICFVELEDDDTVCGKYYSLAMLPGTTADQWKEVGSGAAVTLNNPKTVPNLAARTALETTALPGTATTQAGNKTVNGVGTNWTTSLAIGEEFRFGSTEYYFVESITNDTSMKTTVNTLAHSNEIIYKITVQPNDFVNVTDARTPAEVTANVPAYSASFIWDGTQWLRIYPYAADPHSHVQNTDSYIMIYGSPMSGDSIWGTIMDTSYRKYYNDLADLQTAADGPVVDNNGTEAFTSKRVAQELLLRPASDPVNGDDNYYLNQKGEWAIPPGGDGNGTPLKTGDILGGGGADKTYFGEV